MLAGLRHDLRYAVRMLVRPPAFTVIAVATLAIGIGLNTTIFTAFDAVALKPLPVRNAATLMRLERWFASRRVGSAQYMFSWQEYQYLSQRSHSFPDLLAVSNPIRVRAVFPAIDGSQTSSPVGLVGQLVSANYFSALSVSAAVGRTFAADENSEPGAHPVAVLSYPCWQQRFAGDPAVVGRTVTVNGTAFTIVGVTPREFIGTANPPRIPDFWAPLMMQSQIVPGRDWLNDPLDQEFQLVGHEVQVGAPPRGAAELSVLIRQFLDAHPNPDLAPNADPNTSGTAVTRRISLQRATLFGNTEDLRFRLIVAVLMTVAGMVLLIASANLANMLLARATGRQREIGVRLALGASRARLIRQLLVESVLLAVLGGVAGVIVAIWAGDLLWAAVVPFLGSTALVIPTAPDARVLAYALLVSVVTGVVFGLAPALQAARSDLVPALKDEHLLPGLRGTRTRLRELLVAGQVATSMVFLISAGLLARGLIRSQSADPGYTTRSIYLMPLAFGNDSAQANVRARQAIDRLLELPQIADVAVVERPPMMWTWTVDVRAADPGSSAAATWALANRVSGSYFHTMNIPLVRGRTFARAEEQFGATVAIISEAAARTLWPGADPVGKRLSVVLTRDGPWSTVEVVGVAGDVRTATLSRTDPAMAYFPTPDSELASYWLAMGIRGEARSAVAAIGAALVPIDVRFTTGFTPLNLDIDVVRPQKLITQTLSMSAAALAVLALVLAAVGIYGVASFMTNQREHEVGVRMALGAQARDVSRLIVRDGMKPVMAGGFVGLLASLAVSGILRATLALPGAPDLSYGVGAFDTVSFAVFGGVLGLTALAACYIPARRAARVDPLVALRRE